ncbi:MAG TPA: hypothetical protein VFU85_11195 [Nocardioides sp.]|nr:hypothetical protein [Nocardioides sp.]
MPGFADLDQIIESMTALDDFFEIPFCKYSTVSESQTFPHSLWRAPGVPGPGGDGAAFSATPGAGGTALDQDGLSIGWGDTSPATKHLIGMDVRATSTLDIILFDRLVSVSGRTINSTGAKDVNSVALPRYTDGVGVEVYLEVTTATTAAAVVTLSSYTDQGGTGGQAGSTSVTFPAAATNVDTLVGPMPLATGDYGVRSVEQINVGTSGAGSAAVNVVLLKELARVPVAALLSNSRDFVSQISTLPRVYDGAALMLAFHPSSTSQQPQVHGHLTAAYR